MSDIGFSITWWQLLIFSPVIGWPGLVLGAVAGVMIWRSRRMGGVLGAIIGNLIWFFVVLYLK